MKNTLIIASSIILSVLISCSNNSTSNQSSELDVEQQRNLYDIELVNNEKWVVNDEMMVHIRNMESDIDYISNQTNPNFKDLGSKLDSNIGLLTSNCTMTGKAHDELHKWLLPFIDLVKELNAAESEKKQKDSFIAIQESMDEFNTYFE